MAGAQAGAEAPRRFYKEATAAERGEGFAVLLDGRTAKTPAGAPLVAPTRALAELLAAEWSAQGEVIDPATMPATRMAATVIDRTAAAGEALAAEVARYGEADVLCYRAEGPVALVEEEDRAWTPLLDWAREALGVALAPVEGVMHRPQPPEALGRIRARVETLAPFRQAAVAYLAPLYGSAVLALAVEAGRLGAEEAFDISRLDEAFQEARWGEDAEAAARIARLREEVRALQRWCAAL